jgi:hypothetical protein
MIILEILRASVRTLEIEITGMDITDLGTLSVLELVLYYCSGVRLLLETITVSATAA